MGTRTSLDHAGQTSVRGARIPTSAALIAVLIFVGAGVLLYPNTASWFSQVQQSKVVNAYGSSVETLGPVGRAAALEQAQAYNNTLSGGAVVDPFTQVPAGELAAEGEQYRKELSLSPDGVMARLRIPSIKADLPVFHGTSDRVLQKGVGHLFGTALPVGGLGTHAVLTGHTGVPETTLFTHLDQVKMGEHIEVEVYGEALTYQVDNIEVVLPTETDSLRPAPGEDLLSLVTCTPTGINTHRLIVTGKRIATPPAEASSGALAGAAGPPWWAAGLGMAATVSLAVLWKSGPGNRPRQES